MAEFNRTTRAPTFDYRQCLWGDLIYGTKAELQRLGLGAGTAFPGEPDGPKRKLTVIDPRGFRASIEEFDGKGLYSASIRFPGREAPDWHSPKMDFAQGVTVQRYWCADVYAGTADALAGAGLARLDQFPGLPGMRKVTVVIYPDGTVAGGPPTANNSRSRESGCMRIHRKTKSRYDIWVFVSGEEKDRREASTRREMREYEARMEALPRPAPLTKACAHLRLVWSAPACRTFNC